MESTPLNPDNYDAERLEYGSPSSLSPSPLRRGLHLPRVRRLSLMLLVIDLIITLIVVHAFQPLITLLVRNEELFGPRLVLDPKLEVPARKHDLDTRIPRILHQTSADAVVPEKWAAAQKSCTDVYSDWEYMHWTDDSAREFIEAEYPWFVDTWDNYPFPIIRADAIRYFVLYHYGGLYLDMDTLCNATIPLEQIDAMPSDQGHHAVFKSTTPTGVSNDLMLTSKGHPLFLSFISNLVSFNNIARPVSVILPYVAIMIAAGPMMVTLVMKDYLIAGQPDLPPATAQVINATQLAPFITDLESCSWHQGDAALLMYIGERPWIWFALGAIGWVIGLHIINRLAMRFLFKVGDPPSAQTEENKRAKLT